MFKITACITGSHTEQTVAFGHGFIININYYYYQVEKYQLTSRLVWVWTLGLDDSKTAQDYCSFSPGPVSLERKWRTIPACG